MSKKMQQQLHRWRASAAAVAYRGALGPGTGGVPPVGEVLATREIADELHLSVKTVETCQAHIKDKLSLRSGCELIQHAIQWKMNEKAT